MSLPACAPRLAVLRTAYLSLPEANVVVGDERGVPFLELIPRPGADTAGMAARVAEIFAGQLIRVGVERAGVPVKTELTRRMLGLAGRAAARPQAAAGLAPDDAARVEGLLAETGEWEKDPAAIKTVWSALKRGR